MPLTTWSSLPELSAAHQTLLSYRNDDGGWGEHRTQASRITNTCEATWALGYLGATGKELDSSIDFIERAINGANPQDRQNCSYVRDYAWCVRAVCSAASSDSVLHARIAPLLEASLEKIKTRKLDQFGNTLGTDSDRSSVFIATLVLLAFTDYIQFHMRSGTDVEGHRLLALDAVNELLRMRNRDGGWGDSRGSVSNSANTAYAFAALSTSSAMFPGSIDVSVLQAASNFLRSSNLDAIFFERPLQNNVRPYRHFSIAWALIGYSAYVGSDLAFSAALARRLLGRFSAGGWSIFSVEGRDVPLTWTTALAAGSLALYSRTILTRDLLGLVPEKTGGPLRRARRRIIQIRRERPRRFMLMILLVPSLIMAGIPLGLSLQLGLGLVTALSIGLALVGVYLTVVGVVHSMFDILKETKETQ